ncbi:MAG: deoxyribodipyrimidine photo-lyase [Methanomassiliicoccales archaeon]|nr:deoxyribodipyrimidine photo-lyase [Methanomassiliicoccales archaeon]NYT15605.1 deoxyribodipyrimidine photo-lyase [Methanomassiliicoccales archaeon]
MKEERIWYLGTGRDSKGPVVYWMSRDQRSVDNWALLHAQEIAISKASSLFVIFNLVPDFLGADERHYRFMLEGLREVESSLSKLGIPFILLEGDPKITIPGFVEENGISYLVMDFDPLRIKRNWKKQIVGDLDIPVAEVDAHNIIPCWVCSGKQEYGAHTIRPKIQRALPSFLDDLGSIKRRPYALAEEPNNDWERAYRKLDIDREVPAVTWLKSGQIASLEALGDFIEHRLESYDEARNDPNLEGQSGLSAYLHFGQLSAQRVAMEVSKSSASQMAKNAFLEELVVRRELSDNFCFYNHGYDSFEGFPSWARQTLDIHREDRRDYLYSRKELEDGRTHDDLWNAAQLEMVVRGKMHGYMRMYWAKKILEWTESPEVAIDAAIYLNDKYELDGRDPNGYTGIAWSIGGVHDRAWAERSIFGKVRYMSFNGARRKFDVDSYIENHLGKR